MSSLFLQQSIPEILRNLRDQKITCHDLTDVVSEQIDKNEENTKAWVNFSMEKLKCATEKNYIDYKLRGYLLRLDGIPFGVKDIFNTKDFPTEFGSPLWEGFTPGNNARVVDSILDEGGLIVGKTVTAEFAVHALNETMNPHNVLNTPGTSSSGSAAAVARGMVPFALASQTAGSIVRPSSFCGVWGMKPSFGMIPRTGVLKTTDTLDTIGFIAAHAESLRPILDCVRVKGPDYPYVYQNIDKRGANPKSINRLWRVGLVKSHVWPVASSYAKQAVSELAKKIDSENGFEVEEIEWPIAMHTAHEIHSLIYNKSLSYYFQHEKEKEAYITPIMRKMIGIGAEIGSEQFRAALIEQNRICELLFKTFKPYDIVLSLGTASSAPRRGVEELLDPSLIWTLAHLPVIAAPTFRCPNGLPFGVQFISTKWNDYLLFQCVEELIQRGVLPSGSMKISGEMYS